MTAGHSLPTAFVIPETKVARYLLDPDRPKSKADFLMRFGFSPDRPLELMDALGRHPDPHCWTAAFEAQYGVKHYFEGPLMTPDGRNPYIRSVWQVAYGDPDGEAKFVTIRPIPRPAEGPE